MILKKSLNLLINYFSRTDDGIVYQEKYIRLKKHIFDNSIFNQNSNHFFGKFIFFILNILILFLSIIFLPLAIILYILGYKISTTDSRTIGYHFEEMFFLECYCLIKKIHPKKIIVYSPKTSSSNQYVDEFYFSKRFFLINNIFYGIIIIPLSQWNFLKVDILLLKNQKSYILPSQIYKNYNNYKKKIIITRQEAIQKFAKKILYFKSKFILPTKSLKQIQVINLQKIGVNLNSKIALIKLRETKNSHYRNSNITRLISVIKYLLKQNYKVIRIVDKSSKNSNFKNKNYIEINIENNNGKKIHALLLPLTKLFIGNISGPYNWTSPLFFPCHYIFFDLVNFSEMNPRYKKTKYLFKKIKNLDSQKILSIKHAVKKYPEIFKIYTNQNITKLKFVNNSGKVIIDSIKKLK